MDRLARLRAPLAVVALVALTLVAAARVGLGLSELGPTGSRAVAAARLAPNASDGALTLLVAFLVVVCFVAPAVPSGRRLAAWGAALTVVSLLATLVALALTSAEVAGWSLVWLVPEVAVPVVVGVGLLALARRPTDERVADADARTGAQVAAQGDAQAVESTDDPSADPDLQPGWTSDSAAGAVWRTAGEAASGAPASGWGQGQDVSPGTGWGQAAADDPSAAWGRPRELSAPPDDPADR